MKLMEALETIDGRLRELLLRGDLTLERKQVLRDARADLNKVESSMLIAGIIDPEEYGQLLKSRLGSLKRLAGEESREPLI